MIVIVKRQALLDLTDIALYIEEDDPRAADRIVDALEQKALSLDRFPNRGRDISDILPGLRALRHEDYWIVYEIDSNEVNVLRFIHAARDRKTLFGREE